LVGALAAMQNHGKAATQMAESTPETAVGLQFARQRWFMGNLM